MSSALQAAKKAAIVYNDRDGSCYLVLHPIYSSPPRTRRRVGVCHLCIVLLSFLAFFLAVAGHLKPYAQTAHGMQRWYLWARAWMNGQVLPLLQLREDALLLRTTAAATVVLSFLSLLIASSLPSAWSRAESARVEEEAANAWWRAVCTRRAAPPASSAESAGDSNCTLTYERASQAPHLLPTAVENRGEVGPVAYEVREQKRRRALHRIATATALSLLCASVSGGTTAALLAFDYAAVRRHEEADAFLGPGFTCLALASICECAGVVMAMSPTLSHVRPLRRPAALARCLLMRVAESVRAVDAEDAFARQRCGPPNRAAISSGTGNRAPESKVEDEAAVRQQQHQQQQQQQQRHRPQQPMTLLLESEEAGTTLGTTITSSTFMGRTTTEVMSGATTASSSTSAAVTPYRLDKVIHRGKRRQEE